MIRNSEKLFISILAGIFLLALSCILLLRCFGIELGTVSLSRSPRKENISFICDGKLNINEATEVHLTQLPGVGTTLAKRIVQYRNSHGEFESSEDLLKIKGMNKRTVESIEPYITFGGAQ